MNQFSPEFLEKSRTVFTDNPGITLQDVRDRVAEEPLGTARRDTLSALDATSKLFKRALTGVPATSVSLRGLFARRNAASLGVSKKRYANIKSAVMAAVRKYAVLTPSLTGRIPLTESWTALLGRVEAPDYASGLRRLACFCSAMGVEPASVSPSVLLGFYDALVTEGTLKDPKVILSLTITYWNMQGRRVSGWPPQQLSSPFPSTRFIRSLAEFPTSLQTDIANWQARLLNPDVMDEDAPPRASRPITVEHQTGLIRRFASVLVDAGILSIGAVTDLSVLARPDIAKQGLKIILKRGTSEGYVRGYASLLLAIARHYCKLPAGELKSLAHLVQRLSLGRRRGLTVKNRERLTQFDDPVQFPKLVAFPDDERARGLKEINPYRQAKYFERALAAGILIFASIRVQNLCHLQIERNIRWMGDEAFISFDESEMKNGRRLELALPAHITALLKEFLETYRPRLPGAAGPYLFPGESGGHRHHSTLRYDFKHAVYKHLGVTVNPHLMRHLTSTVLLDKDPSLLSAVSQRLGHASFQTTIDSYAREGSRPASKILNDLLTEYLARKGKK